MKLNRRDFVGSLSGLAGVGAAFSFASRLNAKQPFDSNPEIRSTFHGVAIGCNTYSLPKFPLDDAIRAIADMGFGMAELHPLHLEPSFGNLGRGVRRGAPLTPEQQAAVTAARERLREWRLTVPLEEIEAVGKKFKTAGLFLYAYNMNYRDDFTDEEIDRTFQMTRALGCNLITAVGSKKLFGRLDAFAQKHKIWVGIHNEMDSLPTTADFDEVLRGRSSRIGMTLDIGHFVASGSDPVPCLETHIAKTFDLHLKDRKKNNGPSLVFGQGDTPVKQILQMCRDGKYRIPAHIEYDAATEDRLQGVKLCLEYCKQALNS
jgi:sugar phosphate isomerase/epimerase